MHAKSARGLVPPRDGCKGEREEVAAPPTEGDNLEQLFVLLDGIKRLA